MPPDEEPPPEEPPPEEPPPEEPPAGPRMLSAAVFGTVGPTGALTVAKAGGTDEEYAELFERAARKMRGQVP